MRKLMSRPEGFTLIELMIVILIIAILVAIAVPVYLNAKKGAEKRTCQANIRTVDGSIQAYEAMFDDPQYPDVLTRLTETNTQTLKSIPKCPQGGNYVLIFRQTPPIISCPVNSEHKI